MPHIHPFKHTHALIPQATMQDANQNTGSCLWLSVLLKDTATGLLCWVELKPAIRWLFYLLIHHHPVKDPTLSQTLTWSAVTLHSLNESKSPQRSCVLDGLDDQLFVRLTSSQLNFCVTLKELSHSLAEVSYKNAALFLVKLLHVHLQKMLQAVWWDSDCSTSKSATIFLSLCVRFVCFPLRMWSVKVSTRKPLGTI